MVLETSRIGYASTQLARPKPTHLKRPGCARRRRMNGCGWVIAVVATLYSLYLTYSFVKSRCPSCRRFLAKTTIDEERLQKVALLACLCVVATLVGMAHLSDEIPSGQDWDNETKVIVSGRRLCYNVYADRLPRRQRHVFQSRTRRRIGQRAQVASTGSVRS